MNNLTHNYINITKFIYCNSLLFFSYGVILQKLDLAYHRSYLESQEKHLQELDSVLSKKELNLQFASNNFKESLKSSSSLKSRTSEASQESAAESASGGSVEEVWERPPVTDSVGQSAVELHSINQPLAIELHCLYLCYFCCIAMSLFSKLCIFSQIGQ